MSRDALKMTVAVTFLAGAVGLLAFQLVSRQTAVRARSSGTGSPGAMMEEEARAQRAPAAAWTAPPEGVEAVLARNPFVRPGAVTRKAPRGVGAGAAAGLRVTGIRTGETKATIINDRILREGDTIAGWRVDSIGEDRVTLRDADGKTMRLAAK